MNQRSRFISLIVLMAFVAVSVAGSAMALLYEAALDQRRNDLSNLVKSQARLLEAMARYDAEILGENDASTWQNTVAQLVDAQSEYGGFGESGEFMSGRRKGEWIEFILPAQNEDQHVPLPVAWDSALAEPMRRALKGQSGTLFGPDYKGETVLAAFEPVRYLDIGIVAKVYVAEVRAPYIWASLYASAGGIILIILGAIVFRRISQPMIDQLELTVAEQQRLIDERTKTLRLAKEEAERANRAKSQFLAHMSHDLRTPLNSIIGFADMMREKIYGPLGSRKNSEYVDFIYSSGNHLLSLINDILDMSKIESGEFEISENEVDPVRLLTSVRNLFFHDMETRGIRIETRFPEDCAQIAGDERALTQILVNILSNAVKFSEDGGNIKLFWSIDADGRGIFRVADQGCGIEARRLDKLFEPFTQGEAHVTLQGSGTGLGLCISRRLIEFHGGSLEIQSRPGEGTEVIIILPAERIKMRSEAHLPVQGTEDQMLPDHARKIAI